MTDLNEIAGKLDVALSRLETAVDNRLALEAEVKSGTDTGDTAAASEELISLRQTHATLEEEHNLLKEDASGLSRRLTSTLLRLDNVLADS